MTTETTKATAYDFSIASLYVKSEVINGKVYWYGDNSDNLSTRYEKTSRGCGRRAKTVGNPWKRISKAAAAEILAKYSITLEQFRAYENGELETAAQEVVNSEAQETAEVNTVETEAQEVNTVEEKTEVSEYKPQTSWENPHTYETEGDLDTDRYLAARNHFTTVEDLLPELDALKIEADNVNEKYMRVRFALYICNHFYLNEVRKVLFPIRDEYYTEAAIMIDDAEKLYGKLKAINFDVITRNLKTFEYIRKGISNETYAATEEIFEEIRDKLGDKILASELTKLADEFGIDRALLLQSSDCRFNPALFDEKPVEPAPEPTGRMKWAIELLGDYTYEFECDKETGKKGLARHYKRFNSNGEQVGKLVEIFTDKSSFILDHINIGNDKKAVHAYYYINGEKLSYFKGEFNFLWSDKYKAGMSAVGGEHLQVEVPDGQWKKYKNFAVNNDEFFQIMSERGACSFETEPPKPPLATFKVGEVYRADWRKADDGLANFRILGRSIMFVTAMPVAFAECDAFDEDKDYVFKAKIRSDERGEFFNYDDMTVSAGEAYKLDEPAPVETKLPPAESFTAKRDRLIAERAFANVTFAEAEKNFKAAKLAKYNADDKLYTFMVSAVEELNEKLLPLPDAEIEVKTMEGYLAFIYPETVYADFTDMKFTLRGDCSELNGVTLGTYDTPEQVSAVIDGLKAAIERGDKRFDFANPGQNFDKRAMRASLERAMKIALERHAEFCHAGKLSDAEDEMKLYAIYAQAMKELGKGVME